MRSVALTFCLGSVYLAQEIEIGESARRDLLWRALYILQRGPTGGICPADLLYRSNNPPCCSAPRHRTVFGSNTVSSGSIHLSSHRRCPLRTPVRNHIRCRRHKSRLGNMVACNTLDEFVRSTIDVGLGQV